MTNAEAIKILQKLYEGCNKHKNTDLIKDAYNLAIEALKAQDVPDTNVGDNGDTISRQAAIDKFEPWLKVKGYSDGELNMLKAVLYELQLLPSAQTEEDCDICKHGYFGDDQCNNCRVRYPSHYERRTDE